MAPPLSLIWWLWVSLFVSLVVVDLQLTWAWVGVGFDDGGDCGFWRRWRSAWWRSVGGEIGVAKINGWRDQWIGFWFYYEFWFLILQWILSFDFAIDFGWMAKLGFDLAQKEWYRWWIGIFLGLWQVWGHGCGCLEVVWLRGWLLCDESDRETEIRKERDIICLLFYCIIYIILMSGIVK